MIHHLYLPIVAHESLPQYGVQVDGPLTIPVIPDRLYQSPARWMGLDSFLADNVTAFRDNPFIIGTKTCPEEYRLWADKPGSPPRPECYQNYVDFVRGLAKQYHPWEIEVWNEPDAPNTVPADQQYWYGAWVAGDNFYGAGRAYGDLLAMVHPALQELGVLTIGGALLGAGDTSLAFLRGMQETGDCDYVSMHLYCYYGSEYVQRLEDSVNRILDETSKPLLITETALLSPEGAEYDTPEFEQAQAEYLVWLRDQMAWDGIPWLWYSSDNTWRNCGLVRRGVVKKVHDVWSQSTQI